MANNPFDEITDRLESIERLLLDLKNSNASSQIEERLLSPAEACKKFDPAISRSTIDNWTKEGHLKSYAIGGRKYYKFSEILEAVKSLKKYKAGKPLPQNDLNKKPGTHPRLK